MSDKESLKRERKGWISSIVVTGIFAFFIGYGISLDEAKNNTLENYWGKNANDVTPINENSNGQCKWGTSGNQCMTVGEYLNWCVSAPRNGVTENPLDFCIEVMTGKDLRQPYQGIPYDEQFYANGSKFYLINGTFVKSNIVEEIVKEFTK